MQEFVDKYLLESHHFKSRPEKLTTEDEKKFNILTLSGEEVWDILVFLMIHMMRGRYVSHTVEEKFTKIHALKRIETGTVEYWLHIKYQIR